MKATHVKRALALLGAVAALSLAPAAATTQTLAADKPILREVWVNVCDAPAPQAHIPRLPE